jgi:hypothetical protein
MLKSHFICFLFVSTIIAVFPCSGETDSFHNEQHEITFNLQKMDASTVSAVNDKPEKHYLAAFGGMMLVNTTISSWNRFVSRASWAKVGWDDVIHFYDRQQSWDTDWYWTNFALHPYQGALTYMAARGSNLNAAESFFMATLASTAWEYLYELNAPSKNDLIYTPIGGFAVGEMFYRLSLEADQINRLYGYLINPMRTYTEFVTGEKPRGTTGHIYDISLKFSVGTTKTYSWFSGNDAPDSDSELYPVFISPEFTVIYNDPYGWDSNEPYSQFELTMGGAFGAGSGEDSGSNADFMYDITILSNGMLFSRAPDMGENKDTTIGIVFDYDFIWHSFMELSALSPGFAIKQRIRNKASTIEWQWHLDTLLLGTSDYYYFMHDLVPETKTRREYSYNTGFESVFMWKRTGSQGQTLNTGTRFYAMWDFPDQVQTGAHSGWDFVCISNLDYEVPVSSHVNIGFGNNLYLKKCIYYGAPDIFQTVYTGTVFARLKPGQK